MAADRGSAATESVVKAAAVKAQGNLEVGIWVDVGPAEEGSEMAVQAVQVVEVVEVVEVVKVVVVEGAVGAERAAGVEAMVVEERVRKPHWQRL